MTTDDPQAATKLRATMVSELHDLGAIRSESVAAAVATVPRHLFAPGAPLEDAYAADNPLVIKCDVDGKALSSMSAAHIQVVMLEQAGIEAGMRVLEIGSGGYNAALLAEIVGEQGRVTTVDIDDGVSVRLDDDTQQVDVAALRQALHSPGIERWSGAAFDLPDELELFLLTSDPHMATLLADQERIDQELLAGSTGRGAPVLISGGSFAYRTSRENEETGGHETGVIAHGPSAEQIAGRYVESLRRWGREHRRRGAATIRYLPKSAAVPAPSSGLITKRHGAVVVSWP
ncbi:hypothetical protein [Nonomuraea dietziae]|uniref:hypothetical protein n=1 Tax=Nonomuraea dietziae TaxID=65515 RepID=UPI00341A4DC6